MDKSKLFGKAWRLIKVIYFLVTIPLLLFLVWEIIDSLDFRRDNGYFFDWYLALLFVPGIILGYIIFTDILRRILTYIDDWNFFGFIPYAKFWLQKLILFIIWVILFSGLMVFGSESKRSYCSSDFESINNSNECVCDFGYKREKNICIEDVKKYRNDGISFTYPSYLNVSEKPFEVFEFFNSENIHVTKHNIASLVTSCVDSLSEIRSDGDKVRQKKLKNELFEEYKNKILKIQKWDDIYPMDYFDYISCNFTKWPINILQTTTNDWTNGAIINYYFTQDDESGCLTQVNTELLLVKNENQIYSIIFRNNFWEFLSYMQNLRTKYWWKLSEEACMTNDIWNNWLYEDSAKQSADDVPAYFSRGISLWNKRYRWIENNDKIIQEIIKSVTLY